MKPLFSVLLPARLGYASVAAAVDAWAAQTRRDAFELLVLYADAAPPTPQQEIEAKRLGFVLVPTGARDLHEARQLGVHLASAPYVLLAEDHCLPDPDFAAALAVRLEQPLAGGWDAIGPALRAGNRDTPWGPASFLLGYGQWLAPMAAGKADVLCGHNGTIRKDLLLAVEPHLAEELVVAAFLSRRLVAGGCRVLQDPDLRMRHFDPPGWRSECRTIATVGASYGALRTRRWPWVGRMAFASGAVFIGLLHFRRAWRHYWRAARPHHGYGFDVLGAAAVLALVWGLGEAAGAVLGLRWVIPRQWRAEVKPPSRADVARADLREAAAHAESAALVADRE